MRQDKKWLGKLHTAACERFLRHPTYQNQMRRDRIVAKVRKALWACEATNVAPPTKEDMDAHDPGGLLR